MKFVLLALFVVSSSAFATTEEIKKVTTEKTHTHSGPSTTTDTTTVTEKKEACPMVDGKEDCKAKQTKHTKKVHSKKTY